ncbi:MAG: ABC transporter ATP-binding protein [Clostridiales bacterium]|jgi:branched-chain amino acid transport system ATP-binding protein|nr:ABC transporter ATP-binding protein [Clostridiales bacterium]
MMLEAENLTMRFGGVTAVDSLSLEVPENEIIALIGPNGAGKTTVFNMITGTYAPTSGKITFRGRDITARNPSYIAKQGIGRTFQNIRLFKGLTVFENVITAKHLHLKSNLFQAVFRISGLSPYPAEERKFIEETESLLEKLDLLDLRDATSTSLPYGKQRRLEIARALATNPSLLLLDEPAAGMNPQETIELARFIERIRDEFKITILLIEHHMDLVMDISKNIYVMDFGVNIAVGSPAEIQGDRRVIEAYLGSGD